MESVIYAHLPHFLKSILGAGKKGDLVVISKVHYSCDSTIGSKLTSLQEGVSCDSAPAYQMIVGVGIDDSRKHAETCCVNYMYILRAILHADVSCYSPDAGAFY